MKIRNERIQLSKTSLVAFDLDGTLTTTACRSSWQFVHEFFGTWETHGKAILQRFIRGEISYYEFCKADAEVWKGQTEDDYQEALSKVEIRDGTSELISFLKENRCMIIILSMGLLDLVERIGKQLDFDHWIGNELIRNNNRIVGEVKINIGWQEKGTVLRKVLNDYQKSPRNSIAIGDSTADIEMFDVAGTSIAIEPSSKRVAEAADFVCQTTNLKELITYFKTVNDF